MDNLGDDMSEMPTDDIVIPQGIADVRLGAFHTCVLAMTGEVFCWGRADRGQLGTGNAATLPTPSTMPVRVGGLVVEHLASNEDHSCVGFANGAFRCWGYSASGQIGYGTMESLGDDPTDFVTTDLPLMNVTLAAPGGSHTCALLANDDVHCWGRGEEGQLGYGNSNWIGADPGSLAGSSGSVF
jgi:alpha-tubulin suppressor-like RCC1 family protein